MKSNLAIISIGVVSRFGLGLNNFLNGISNNPINKNEQTPDIYKVHDFDMKQHLGKKVRYLNKNTGMSLVAINQILNEVEITKDYPKDEIGVGVGTNIGSLETTLNFTNDTFIQERPYYVDPSVFPQGVLNYFAGTAAIRLDFRGVNMTVSNGRMTGFEIINYASNVIETEQSKILLIGAVEEGNEYSDLLYSLQRKVFSLPQKCPGEGAVFLCIEDVKDATEKRHNILAEIIDVKIKYSPRKAQDETLETMVEELLINNSLTYDDIKIISSVDNINKDGVKFEKRKISNEVKRINIEDYVGDCLSITNLFQIIALTSCSKDREHQYCLIYTLDESEVIGCSIIKI